jgi:pSer/pThr/pTyr-binding forkhead associated (FHA) protein
MTKLVFEVRRGVDVISVEKFSTSTIKVGNLRSSHLKLDDPSVSRMHCVIEMEGDEVSVFDLGSPQGTRVNGVKVQKSIINRGDVVGVGVFDLALQLVRPTVAGDGKDKISSLLGDLEEKVEQMEADAAFINLDTETAFKAALARMKSDERFREGIQNFVTDTVPKKTKGEAATESEMEDLLGELDVHVTTFEAIIGLAEGVKGKFDIPRAAKAIDSLIDELDPVSKILGNRLVEFRSVFDGHMRHRCVLLSTLVKDMMDLGLSEENAMKIMEKNWSSMIKTAVESVVKAAEPHIKVTKADPK